MTTIRDFLKDARLVHWRIELVGQIVGQSGQILVCGSAPLSHRFEYHDTHPLHYPVIRFVQHDSRGHVVASIDLPLDLEGELYDGDWLLDNLRLTKEVQDV